MKDGIPETFRFSCRGDTREPRSQNRFEARLERSDGTVVYAARCELSTAMDPRALETTLIEDYLNVCYGGGRPAARDGRPRSSRQMLAFGRAVHAPGKATAAWRRAHGVRTTADDARADAARRAVAEEDARERAIEAARARRARAAREKVRAELDDERTGVPEADRRRRNRDALDTRAAATLTPRRRAARGAARGAPAPARPAWDERFHVDSALSARGGARRPATAGERAAAAAADAPPWDEGADPEEVRELDLLLRRMCAKDGAWEHADPVSIAAKRDRLLVALVDRAWREG